MKTYLLLVFYFLNVSFIFSQKNLNWIIYNTSNSGLPYNYVRSLAIDVNDNKWIGTINGPDGRLSKFDGTNWITYVASGGGYSPSYPVTSIAIDLNSNVWIGTLGVTTGTNFGIGCAKFDGTNWTTFSTNPSNSTTPPFNVNIPDNINANAVAIDANGIVWIGSENRWNGSSTVYGGLAKYNGSTWTNYSILAGIFSIAIDGSNNKWCGRTNSGVEKYDGTNWTLFNASNSGLPNNNIRAIAIDGSDSKWIGTNGGGLINYDGTNWVLYNTSNSGLPNDSVFSIAIDNNGIKWIGTKKGLTKFDGTNWTTYDISNSSLPDNMIWTIKIDGNDNKWIGTQSGGLAVFNEGGIVSINKISVNDYFNLYPNPTRNNLTIETPQKATLEIINIQGQLIKTLQAIDDKTSVDVSALPSGVYIIKLNTAEGSVVRKFIKE